MSIDFNRVQTLLGIEQATREQPQLLRIRNEAWQELLKIERGDEDRGDRIVTPPAGPENSAVQHPDGSLEQLPPQQPQQTGMRAVPSNVYPPSAKIEERPTDPRLPLDDDYDRAQPHAPQGHVERKV